MTIRRNNLNELPDHCDLRALGLDPDTVRHVDRLHDQHGHTLHRLILRQRSMVLKWFGDSADASEIRAYSFLRTLGVPTLAVYGATESALLLEDLTTSSDWRIASKAAVHRTATGIAVAGWYRRLPVAGRAALSDPSGVPAFLKRESDSVYSLSEAMRLPRLPRWVTPLIRAVETGDLQRHLERAIACL